jgi:hypothetical protein
MSLVYSAMERSPPPPPPPRTRKGPPLLKHTHKHNAYHAGPYAPTRRPMPSTQVSLHYTSGAFGTLPPSHPHLYISETVGHYPFQPPTPKKREREVQRVQVKGEDGVLRLIPVCFRCAQTV